MKKAKLVDPFDYLVGFLFFCRTAIGHINSTSAIAASRSRTCEVFKPAPEVLGKYRQSDLRGF
jgi:hypothetical protein